VKIFESQKSLDGEDSTFYNNYLIFFAAAWQFVFFFAAGFCFGGGLSLRTS